MKINSENSGESRIEMPSYTLDILGWPIHNPNGDGMSHVFIRKDVIVFFRENRMNANNIEQQ